MREPDLDFLVEQLNPVITRLEQQVRQSDPDLEEAEVLDRALRQGLADLRHELSRQTYDFLKTKLETLRENLERSKAEASAMRFASQEARRQRAARRAAWGLNGVDTECTLGAHSFHDTEGNCWSVEEVSSQKAPWARRPSSLIFSSELGIRRVWDFPPNWRKLDDEDLEKLSWQK